MGKMKNLVIDQMNNDRNGPDDSDWNAPTFDGAGFTEADNQLSPPPDQIDLDNGKSMWIIEEYRIWARSYKEALELLPMIKSF
jgi:hypothetical protein